MTPLVHSGLPNHMDDSSPALPRPMGRPVSQPLLISLYAWAHAPELLPSAGFSDPLATLAPGRVLKAEHTVMEHISRLRVTPEDSPGTTTAQQDSPRIDRTH
ncbi:hypothetical protein OG897_34420 [Streptomyces sp. NBC_00237]|uniref:hypothetical protein n=1 Tax=Streptomyces sp. NBC_00237 TaxID=2975687 RepID=UPI002257300C|nr:hypothetical protein [Streptomyces sp. NBC_00237]MCX5206488.1 hypothetical protein [Streptomyces sp. NBC_00237]